MPLIPIDVRYEPQHDAGVTLAGVRPMLRHWRHPKYGPEWSLYYLDDPLSPTVGVDMYSIGGDLTDVDWAVEQARAYLQRSMTPEQIRVLEQS